MGRPTQLNEAHLGSGGPTDIPPTERDVSDSGSYGGIQPHDSIWRREAISSSEIKTQNTYSGGWKENPPNWDNRTLFHGDNLDYLRAMNSGSVDLIATDPPFNKGRDFHATPESLADGASFQDRWRWAKDVHEDWVSQIQNTHPELFNYIWSVKDHNEPLAAFLCFLAVRLIAMHRVLKPTGSIYLHCDQTASHYIKQVMDIIFGENNFRNEIVWCYKGNAGASKHFGRKHDVIFFYVKSDRAEFTQQYLPYTKEYIARYKHEDEKGKYLWNSNKTAGKYKTYLKKGFKMGDVWTDIQNLKSGNELTGYPTQKPVALYERIIKASSNPGDMVLDPFCGCATTLVAAENLGRQWIGIDLWPTALQLVKDRLADATSAGTGEYFAKQIHSISTPPERTDDGVTNAPPMAVIHSNGKKAGMSKHAIKQKLIADFGTGCQGCGRVFSDDAYLHVDHNAPKSAGGSDAIDNRLLLCQPCNSRKSDLLTIPGLRQRLKNDGLRYIQEKELLDFRNYKPEI